MIKRLCAVAAFLAVSASAFAGGPDNPWSLTGEFLYLKPSVGDTYFATITTESGDEDATLYHTKRYNNDFDFTPGFRVGIGYNLCNCNCPGELLLSYTYLNATEHKDLVAELDSDNYLGATVGPADWISDLDSYQGFATNDSRLRYNQVELAYLAPITSCSCFDITLKAALEFDQLKYRSRSVFFRDSGETSTVISYSEDSRFSGFGPQLGFVFDYPLLRGTCECPGTLALRVESTGSLLVGEQKGSSSVVIVEDTENSYCNEKTWRVVPAFNARIGLGYDFSLECLQAAVEVGYEFRTYVNGLSRTVYPDDVAPSLSFEHYTDFSLQGLYVSATVNF